MSDRDTLLSFGFSEAKVTRALKATNNAGLQPCLDWLEKHADDDDSKMDADEPAEAAKGDEDEEDEEEKKLANSGEPKSLRCMVCGKRFRNTALASYHGDKSGHDQFEESTEEIAPLTEEEKKQKLEELKARMAEKRANKAKLDAEDFKRNEAIRRKGGKDIGDLKEEMKIKEAEKEAAKRKQDKIDDAKAKARVREQIEADKKARADKAAAEKAARAGQPPPVAAASAGPSAASTARVSDGSSASANTRLQLRLPDGRPPVTTTIPSSSTLQSVEDWLRSEHGYTAAEVKFATTFPRKVFTQAEKAKTMLELGLSPSSALMVQ